MAKKQAQTETQSDTPKATKGVAAVGKITVATVCGKIKVADLPPEGEEKPLCKMAGYASGVKSGTTQYGEWHALTGEFAATNLETGEVFMGKTGIVPGAMGDALVDTVSQKLAEDATSKVAFSVIVSVRRSPRNPDEKYEYVVRPVMDAQISSPAMALLAIGN
jgi:hypothetical protein